MTAIIEVEGLTKKYKNGKEALRGLDFTVETGKIFGLLGPNGAGKSTTMSILTTMIRKTQGKVIVDGIDLDENPEEIKKNIGIAFQESTSDTDLTGRENLQYIAGLSGMSSQAAYQKINDLLEKMDLKESADILVKRYSGGMKRKLELAAAMIHDPKIIFLDEPTLQLDPASRAEFWNYIKDLKERAGITIFLNTHYLDEAERLCDAIAIIDQGKIIVQGAPDIIKETVKGDIIKIKVKNETPSFNKIIQDVHGVLEVVKSNSYYLIKCQNSNRVIPSVVLEIKESNVELQELTVIRPSLEQAFLEITGCGYTENGKTNSEGDSN